MSLFHRLVSNAVHANRLQSSSGAWWYITFAAIFSSVPRKLFQRFNVALVGLILVSVTGLAQAEVYRFFNGQHPAGATNPALCLDATEPWYPTASEACQGLKTVMPNCDRSSATYRNYVANLSSPAQCDISWEFQNTGSTSWGSWSASFGVTVQACPSNSTQSGTSCTCSPGFATHPQNPSSCVPLVNTVDLDKASSKNSCEKKLRIGNPIYPLTGVKEESIDTGVGVGGLSLSLVYDTTLKMPANQVDATSALVEPNSFGALWKSSFHHKLAVSFGATKALLSRGDGKVLNFSSNGAGVFTTDADNTHKLVSIAGGYRFTDAATGAQETFDSSGTLLSLTQGNGMVLSFSYAGANLTQVQSSDGRTLRFNYTNNLISQITDPNGRTITPAYDANRNLVSLTWQDGKVSQFLYENTAFPWALTGKVDENNSRFSTFTYDAQGRASASEHAGGVGRYSVNYTQPPQLVITDALSASTGILSRQHGWQLPSGTTLELPNGQSSSVGAASVMGMPSVTSQSQPAGSGCAASTNAMTYDVNGNIASKDDFTQKRSCFANDLSRNLPTVAVEGLANTVDCATVLTTNASLPAGSRKVSTQWHPDWSLTAKAAQPLSITTSVYNGQPDPFNGNAIASCAPTSATTPDGKPIAVLCKQVVQATTDADGSLGLAAPLDTSVAQRTSSFTYDALGRTLTSTDPLSRVTTYAYHSNSTGFSDPTSDASFDSVNLLLHADGANNSTAFTDSSQAARTLTVTGGAKISTAQSKFGGGSLYLDGAGDFLSVPQSPDWDFGLGAFTVDAWVHHLVRPTTAWQQIVGNIDDAGTGGWRILVGVTGQVHFSWYNPSGAAQGISTADNAIPLNQWSHIAVSTSGGITTIFVNGVSQAVFANPGIDTSTQPLLIGSTTTTDWFWNGYIDDLRITKGVARYTANFTPPTQAFPNTGPVIDPNAVGHTTGDLQSLTNAAGHVTQYTQYDRAGRVRQMVDPKGVVTDTVYTPRGWISSVTVTPPGGVARTTSYSYDGVGQLTQAVMPDGTTLGYSYDAAHRLTGVTDAKGNSVTYTLDNMGNRVNEQVKGPQGGLQRSITRVYDALNRVQQITGAGN